MRRFLVSSFFAEVTQQIHSFRARGVMAAQRRSARASDSMALRKSAGSLWIVPLLIALVVMRQSRSVSQGSPVIGPHRPTMTRTIASGRIRRKRLSHLGCMLLLGGS